MSVRENRTAYSAPKDRLLKFGMSLRMNAAGELSDSVTRTRAKAGSEIIGMTALEPKRGTNVSYVATARVASGSVRENPLVQVDIDRNGYQVHVNTINPRSASQLEIFALCSYADYVGITRRDAFDTFCRFRQVSDYAALCGYGGVDDFIYGTIDWENVIGAVKDNYLELGAYDQYLECQRLIDLFDHQQLRRRSS